MYNYSFLYSIFFSYYRHISSYYYITIPLLMKSDIVCKDQHVTTYMGYLVLSAIGHNPPPHKKRKPESSLKNTYHLIPPGYNGQSRSHPAQQFIADGAGTVRNSRGRQSSLAPIISPITLSSSAIPGIYRIRLPFFTMSRTIYKSNLVLPVRPLRLYPFLRLYLTIQIWGVIIQYKN